MPIHGRLIKLALNTEIRLLQQPLESLYLEIRQTVQLDMLRLPLFAKGFPNVCLTVFLDRWLRHSTMSCKARLMRV